MRALNEDRRMLRPWHILLADRQREVAQPLVVARDVNEVGIFELRAKLDDGDSGASVAVLDRTHPPWTVLQAKLAVEVVGVEFDHIISVGLEEHLVYFGSASGILSVDRVVDVQFRSNL